MAAQNPRPSTLLTVSAAVSAISGVCYGFAVASAGTGEVTVELFDGADDTGTPLYPALVLAVGETSGGTCHRVQFTSGLYVKITGTPTGVIAYLTGG